MKEFDFYFDLNPCPFCGSDKLSVVSKRSTTYATTMKDFCKVTLTVRCNVCKSRGGTASAVMPNYHYKFLKETGFYNFSNAYFVACKKWNERK